MEKTLITHTYYIYYQISCLITITVELYVVGVAMAEKIQGLEVDYPHVRLVCLCCADNNPG